MKTIVYLRVQQISILVLTIASNSNYSIKISKNCQEKTHFEEYKI